MPPGRLVFRSQVAPEHAARILRACDALLVSLSPAPELAAFVPSKLFDFCALGRPVMVAAQGEAQRLVANNGAAFPVRPGDVGALAQAVKRLRDDEALRSRLSVEGRQFAEDNLRDRHLRHLESVLDAAARR